MSLRSLLALTLSALALLAASCGGGGARPLTIGILADCEGIFGFAGDPSYAGAELPLIRRGARLLGAKPAGGITEAEVAGTKVKLVLGCGDDTAEKALAETRRLVEAAGADVLIGPLQIGESFPIRDYARQRPKITFVDGTASGQALTLQNPAQNFFRFSNDGAQFVAGLGAYVYRKLGWRRAATVVSGEGFQYTQAAGFVAEFCALGGTIVKRIVGGQELRRYLAQASQGSVDGFFVDDPGLADAGGLQKLSGRLAARVVGGIYWNIPPSPQAVGSPFRSGARLVGIVYAAPTPWTSTRRAWVDYLSAFSNAYPSLAKAGFGADVFSIDYRDAMEAVLEALERVHGDLSGGERRFQAVLARVRLDSPIGRIRLDRNRQAVAPNYILRWEKDDKGNLVAKTIRVVPNVDQSFGGYFHTNGPLPSRTYPPCRHGHPPPWARSG